MRDQTTSVTIIVARAANGVIGQDNSLPWRIPEEMKHFKESTMGHVLIVGRKTFDSIGRALPGRRMIVVTRNADWQHSGCERAGSFDEAIELAANPGPTADELIDNDIFVAGGAQLYASALPLATRLLITEIDATPAGDVFFPDPDPSQWVLSNSSEHHSRSGQSYCINEWHRLS